MTPAPKGTKLHYAIFAGKYLVKDDPPYRTLYNAQFFIEKYIVNDEIFFPGKIAQRFFGL